MLTLMQFVTLWSQMALKWTFTSPDNDLPPHTIFNTLIASLKYYFFLFPFKLRNFAS